jgi:arsenate reductase
MANLESCHPKPRLDIKTNIRKKQTELTKMNNKKRVLILCTGNSARSQMAEGLLRQLGEGKFEVESAGVAPSKVRPEAVEAMLEIGIDISEHRSKSVDEFTGQNFDYIITVCDNAKETCPVFHIDATYIHKSFTDPPPETIGDYQQRLKIFRSVRDQLHKWVTDFIREQ